MTKANSGFKNLKGMYKQNFDKNESMQISMQGVQGIVLAADECVPIGE